MFLSFSYLSFSNFDFKKIYVFFLVFSEAIEDGFGVLSGNGLSSSQGTLGTHRMLIFKVEVRRCLADGAFNQRRFQHKTL